MIVGFLRKLRQLLSNLKFALLVLLCRLRFPSILRSLCAKVARGEKLRVYFIVTDIAKWKCHTVYDRMRESSAFEPVVAVMMNDWERTELREFNKKVFLACCSYFSSKGMVCEPFFNSRTEKLIPLTEVRPDIVFFQQPWYSVKGSMPFDLNQVALTCYIPYFVANYVNLHYDCGQWPHRFYHRHFVLNEQLAKTFRKACAGKAYVGEFVPVGYPALDGIHFGGISTDQGWRMVIYAPHWSLENCGVDTLLHLATFSWNGVQMLQYAQKHPEVDWVFKPHPSLRMALVHSGLMSGLEVENYYRSWGECGTVCETAGYEDLFNRSSALITDCASFLTEYAVTGKPIIHMLTPCSDAEGKVSPLFALYATYYQARSLWELQVALRLVVEEGGEPRYAERLAMLKSHRLFGGAAAENIMQYLEVMLSVPLKTCLGSGVPARCGGNCAC